MMSAIRIRRHPHQIRRNGTKIRIRMIKIALIPAKGIDRLRLC